MATIEIKALSCVEIETMTAEMCAAFWASYPHFSGMWDDADEYEKIPVYNAMRQAIALQRKIVVVLKSIKQNGMEVCK